MEDEIDEILELKLCLKCKKALERYGIRDKASTMVLYGMVRNGLFYWESLKDWAAYEFEGSWPVERWHAEICYRMLKAWILEPAPQFFEMLAQEVQDTEDGISA